MNKKRNNSFIVGDRKNTKQPGDIKRANNRRKNRIAKLARRKNRVSK